MVKKVDKLRNDLAWIEKIGIPVQDQLDAIVDKYSLRSYDRVDAKQLAAQLKAKLQSFEELNADEPDSEVLSPQAGTPRFVPSNGGTNTV